MYIYIYYSLIHHLKSTPSSRYTQFNIVIVHLAEPQNLTHKVPSCDSATPGVRIGRTPRPSRRPLSSTGHGGVLSHRGTPCHHPLLDGIGTHEMNYVTMGVQSPICAKWCWSMNPNICPKKITQFCR